MGRQCSLGTTATLSVGLLCASAISAGPVLGADARIAAATNFRDAAIEIGSAFEAATPHQVVFSFGSTGQLYAQIAQGAPYDVFLAADQERARMSVEAGFAVAGTQFTYAQGRIVLFSMDVDLVAGPDTLRGGEFAKLAIADPALAPYGAAAVEALQNLGSYERVKGRIVRGLNVAQAFQFVYSGNAGVGLVALSLVARLSSGSQWLVPDSLHSPIAQDAVLLRRGVSNPAAAAFLAFLRGPEADAVRNKYGYGYGK